MLEEGSLLSSTSTNLFNNDMNCYYALRIRIYFDQAMTDTLKNVAICNVSVPSVVPQKTRLKVC